MPPSLQVSGLEFCVHFEKHTSHLLFYNEMFCEFAREQSLKPCRYFLYVLFLLYGNSSRMQELRFLDEFRSLASLKLFVRQLLVNKFLIGNVNTDLLFAPLHPRLLLERQ